MIGKYVLHWLKGAACTAVILLFARGPLFSFTSTPFMFTASAFITPYTGALVTPNLATTPATYAYPVSGVLQVGGIVSQSPVSLPQARTARPRTGTGDSYTVMLSYFGIANPNNIANPCSSFSTSVATITQQGTDPFQFIFTIPSSVVIPPPSAVNWNVCYSLLVTDTSNGKIAAFPITTGQYQPVTVGPVTATINSNGGQLVYPTGVLNSNLGYVNSVLDFPAGAVGGGTVRVTMNEVAVLGASGNAAPSTMAGNQYALSPYPEAYSITTNPSNFEFMQPVGATLWYPTSALGTSIGVPPTSESSLQTFVYDTTRNQWSPFSSNQNLMNHTLSTAITQVGSSNNTQLGSSIGYLGYLGIFESVPTTAPEFRPSQKIITPYSSSPNNRVLTFGYLGPSATINFYDITGRCVRHLPAGAIQWDATDDNGNVVPSGVYIYQYKYNGQMVSGAVAVAK